MNAYSFIKSHKIKRCRHTLSIYPTVVTRFSTTLYFHNRFNEHSWRGFSYIASSSSFYWRVCTGIMWKDYSVDGFRSFKVDSWSVRADGFDGSERVNWRKKGLWTRVWGWKFADAGRIVVFGLYGCERSISDDRWICLWPLTERLRCSSTEGSTIPVKWTLTNVDLEELARNCSVLEWIFGSTDSTWRISDNSIRVERTWNGLERWMNEWRKRGHGGSDFDASISSIFGLHALEAWTVS